ncbi:hypothetical protein E4U41_006739 [Claviceps citrina]|nr:hypothetical protein E4U41_006739 [Claviceps citrina]
MFGILETAAVPSSGVYNTYEDLILDLNKKMERQGFKIVKARSHRRKPGGDAPGNEIVRCDLVCDRGGRSYRCQATKHKSKTKKTDCPWKAKAVHRQAAGGWVLTILCNEHNHESGTPELPTPAVGLSDAEDEAEVQTGRGPPLEPQLDANTLAAVPLAGVFSGDLPLDGETFQQFKEQYRNMTQSDRINALGLLHLRLAAICVVQNEDLQRQQRQQRPTAQDGRRLEVEASGKALASQKQRSRPQQKSRLDQDQQSQGISSTIAEPRQGLPHDPIASDAVHAPEALMQEPHFQLADAAGGVGGIDLPHFHPFAGPSRRTRGNRPNAT